MGIGSKLEKVVNAHASYTESNYSRIENKHYHAVSKPIIKNFDIFIKKCYKENDLFLTKSFRRGFIDGMKREKCDIDKVPDAPYTYLRGYNAAALLDNSERGPVGEIVINYLNEQEAKYFGRHLKDISEPVRISAKDCLNDFKDALSALPEENKLNGIGFYKKALRVGFKEESPCNIPIDYKRIYDKGLLANIVFEGFSKKDRQDAYVYIHNLIGADERKLRKEERRKGY